MAACEVDHVLRTAEVTHRLRDTAVDHVLRGAEVAHQLRAAAVDHVLIEAGVTHVLCEAQPIPSGPMFQGGDTMVHGTDVMRQG